MLDIEAPIEPGRGLGGIAVGVAVDEVLKHAEPREVIEIPGDEEDPDGVTIHSFGPIRTWSVAGQVVQVGAFEGYAGTTADGIGIGSTVAEITAACGEPAPQGDGGFVALPGKPGIGIETTPWPDEGIPDPAARVVQIFVHGTD